MNVSTGLASKSAEQALLNQGEFSIIAEARERKNEGRVAVLLASKFVEKNPNPSLDGLVNAFDSSLKQMDVNFLAARVVEEQAHHYLQVVAKGNPEAILIRGNVASKIEYFRKPEDSKRDADYIQRPVKSGDIIVLSTTELGIKYDKISKIAGKNSPEEAAQKLLKKSNLKNASVVVLHAGERPPEKSFLALKIAAVAGLVAAAGISGLIYQKFSEPKTESSTMPAAIAAVPQKMAAPEPEKYFSNVQTRASPAGQYEVKKGDTIWAIVKETYGLSNEMQISEKIKEIVNLNSIAYPDLKKDLVFVENGVVKRGEDGISGDVLVPGQKLELPTRVASAEPEKRLAEAGSIDTLLQLYNQATYSENASAEQMDNHIREIASHYAAHGAESTLDTYSMLHDDNDILDNVLVQAWGRLNCRRETCIDSLSIAELNSIKDAYFSGTNKEALRRIRERTGMDMSISTMYASLDELGDLTGKTYRKRPA